MNYTNYVNSTTFRLKKLPYLNRENIFDSHFIWKNQAEFLPTPFLKPTFYVFFFTITDHKETLLTSHSQNFRTLLYITPHTETSRKKLLLQKWIK